MISMSSAATTLTDAATVNLRLVYCAIFITRDDSPEDRAAWSAASEAEQRKAAASFHAEYGGRLPHWV